MQTKTQTFGQRATKMRETAEALRVHADAVREDANMFKAFAETVMTEALLMEANVKKFAERRTTKARR